MTESERKELERLRHEVTVLRARKGILDAGAATLQSAEINKLNAETAKLKIEKRFYPAVVVAGIIAAIATATKLILSN